MYVVYDMNTILHNHSYNQHRKQSPPRLNKHENKSEILMYKKVATTCFNNATYQFYLKNGRQKFNIHYIQIILP